MVKYALKNEISIKLLIGECSNLSKVILTYIKRRQDNIIARPLLPTYYYTINVSNTLNKLTKNTQSAGIINFW